ncbi:MAG: DNA cytosine methyltransferase [Methanosphaera sp.]|nr:DNA cytosine methyltransferase [Methanosphaera sp.]
MKQHTLVSLFSGAGGMDLGFKNAGYEILWANDFDEDATITYKNNIGDHITLGDIIQIPSDDIPDDPDVIIGGFPCQGFSVANTNRSMDDKRNFLYKQMLRIIEDKNPKIFVAENVKGLCSMENGNVIEMIQKDFESLGYKVNMKLLNATDYGVPQNRQRIVIMGNRINVKNRFPKKTHCEKKSQKSLLERENNLKEYVTTKEAIGYLSDVKLSYNPIEVNGKMIYNHMASTNVSDKFWKRKHNVSQEEICDYLKYWRDKSGWSVKGLDDHFGYKYTAGHWFRKDNNSGTIPSPEDWWELKKLLKFDDKYDKAVTELEEKEIVYEQSLRITNWDRPSDTITATGPEIHVNKKRRLSARECAILQSFPDDFIFHGSLSSMYRQIGNAVPVLLAQKIAESTIDMLNEE